MDKTVDILHPLTSMEWRECKQPPETITRGQAVCLKDKVYMRGRSGVGGKRPAARLYINTPATDTWDTLDTPVYNFALTTYRSKLVLVGGREYVSENVKGRPSNKVWTLSEGGEWEETLPPMETACDHASAVSHGDHLLVVDGHLKEVLVYNGQYWAKAQPLPKQMLLSTQCVVYDGDLLVIGEQFAGTNEVYSASLVSLIASCQHSKSSQSSTVWKSFSDAPGSHCYPVVFGERLIVVGMEAIYAYSPSNRSWTNVGGLSLSEQSCVSVVLSSNVLMMIGDRTVFKVTFKVTPFDPDSNITMRALTLIEAMNIPVITGLDDYAGHIRIMLGATHMASEMQRAYLMSEPFTTMTSLRSMQIFDGSKALFFDWLIGGGKLSPTWRNLLHIIREVNLDDLANQVETYLKVATKNEDSEEKERKIVDEKPLVPVPVKTEVKEESVTVTKDETTSAQPTAAWDLRGVEVCGEMTVVVHSSGAQQITWEGFGLKLHIDESSLPAGINQCTLTIKASLAGQYEFPDNSFLVSAIFWLRCEPMCKFTKPVTVEMQHCARSENVANLKLKFVRAVCSQKQLPYTFKELGGDFTRHSSYGVVEVNGFSGLAITQEGPEDRNYLANLLYKEVKGRPTRCIVDIYIAVTWNVDSHYTVMITRFKDAQLETNQPIEFESDQVEFKLLNSSDGLWIVKVMNSSVVKKKDVDHFVPSKTSWIPYSHFKAKFSGDLSSLCDLECVVDVVGAREPNNKFNIDITPEGPITSAQLNSLHTSDPEATRLSSRHLSSLLQQLYEHAAKWRDIGGALGFTQGELDTIQAKPFLLAGGPKSWLGSMLLDWLQWAPGDGRGSTHFATLEKLKDALKQENLGATAYMLQL